MKATADRDISVGGPELAGHAIRAGLVDEYHLFLTPVLVGGGNPSLPGGVRVDLEHPAVTATSRAPRGRRYAPR